MKTEKKNIPSTKGNLSTVFHYPDKQTDRLAILCPGFLDSKDYKHLVGLSEELSKKGYTVIRFDPTGTWESEGDISDYTVTQYLEDIRSVLEYALKENPYTKILVGGHSRGGQLAVLYAARDPRVSLVLGIMPSSGPIKGQRREEWEKSGINISQRDLPDNKDEKKEFRVPFHHVLDRDLYDAVGDAKKIKVPMVLIAGELDELVPPEDVEEIYDNANEPKKFITIAGIGHNYRHSDEEVKMVNEKILEQLNGYL
jgi:pimeloyl-ACP methyl ester carboxylesterase